MHRLFCLLMAFVWSAVLSAKDSKDSRPNFVVILCDDLGYGDLACYGHPHIKTPHLDKLAKQGMRLTSCYAAAPVCSPSRAGMLTGRTPNRSGVYNWIPGNHVMHLRKDEVTVAEMLKESGYDTAHVGKWHCNGKFNSPAQPQPGDHGFNHWFATQNNAAPSHKNPRNFVRNGKPVGPMEGYACQLVADEGVDWLRNGRDKQKPFFLFTCFHEPHEPVASPDKMTAGYSEVARNKLEAEYFANVENMDAAVGKLMATLDELKLADDTLVFFTSDNGPETLRRYGGAARSFGSPGPLRGMKLWLYEGGIRVPGILRFPGRIQPGSESDEPVCGLDVLPTLTALAGIERKPDRAIDGTSFVEVFTGKPIRRVTPLYWHYYNALGAPKAAMRAGDWMVLGSWGQTDQRGGGFFRESDQKLVKTMELKHFELYNLKRDRDQKKNLAETEPARLKELSVQLVKKYREVQAEGPEWKFGK